jgi:predicted O-linked N-acetylglucosamine transferase (SPINDLY family)
MGVPVVALNGTTLSGRIAASMLTALDMREWIAGSDEEYVRIAVEAARDLPRLARTRELLRPRLAASVFGDVQRYTGAVEAAYRTMWLRWCAI